MSPSPFVERIQGGLRRLVRAAPCIAYYVAHTVNVACAIHLFATHVGGIAMADGPSMLPTMNASGDWVLENRWVNWKQIQRGDLVTVRSPLDPNRLICKRVIGLPGDIICVDPTGQYAPSTEHVVIPRYHVWLSGDNAAWSQDSRKYGPVSMALLKGKLVARVWPLRDAGFFRSNFNYID